MKQEHIEKKIWRFVMNINVAFLDKEPIENVITNLNFKMDRVVFFGHEEEIERQRKSIKAFLLDYCNVSSVVFHGVSHYDLQSILSVMRKELESERAGGNRIYFDVTGGESLVLAAFGMLSCEMNMPMHIYDIKKGTLHELDEGAKGSISEDVPKQEIKLDIDKLIRLHGGKVNAGMHKSVKNTEADIVDRMWKIYSSNLKTWNDFSSVIKSFVPEGEEASVRISKLEGIVDKCYHLKFGQFRRLLETCQEQGLITGLREDDEFMYLKYKDSRIKDLLWDGGAVLEIYTGEKFSRITDDCRVGVHIDWDGVIDGPSEGDVLNEIDVIAMDGYVPIFISCKSGSLGKTQSLHALYELDTVASRFGGRYARKILAVPQGLYSSTDVARAEEMGIEVMTEI